MASWYSGQTLTPEQTSGYLYQAGFRGEDLVWLTAVAKRESGYVTGAHRSDSSRDLLSGDRGLLQINYIWDDDLMAAGIIKQKSDLFDPAINAKAAKYIFDRQGRGAWMPYTGKDVSAGALEEARGAVSRAQQQGILSADWVNTQGQTGPNGTPAQSTPAQSTPAQSTQEKPVELPTDAKLIRHSNGMLLAVFNVAPGVALYYTGVDESLAAGQTVETMNPQQFQQQFGSAIAGGDASELKNVKSTFGSYKGFWDSIINQVLPPGNPARNDAGVLRVLAEFAGRPDMSEAELQNKLQGTDYWKSKTAGELAFNSLSPAEQALRRQDAEAKMVEAAFQHLGVQPVRSGDGSQSARQAMSFFNTIIRGHINDVASGKMGYSQWVETILKPRALLHEESPWARQVRSEEEAKRKRPIDIENTANQVRQTLQRWGLRWSEGTILDWGKRIVELKASDGDLLKAVQDQAKVLYPTKDPTIETLQWATPYLETFSRVMEQEGNLFTPEIGRALSQGTNIWDFEMGLKKSSKWLETKNAREEMFTLASEIGQRFGYT